MGGKISPLVTMAPASQDAPGTFDGGVYRNSGEVCDLARMNKPNHTHVPAPIGEVTSRYSGSAVFGGMLQNEHFGHFIVENLGRLWAFDHLGHQFETVAFYLRKPSQPIARFVSATLALVIPEIRIEIVREPTEFDVLAVPGELIEAGYITGHPFNDLMRARLTASHTPITGKKIFVSRSKLSKADGGILGDDLIDGYMAEQGYEILHPQEMSVKDQFAAYTSARRLVFAEGSALHLYALVANPLQHVFVIWRRGFYAIFDWQIRSFGGNPVYGKPSIEQLWVPEHEFPDAAHGKAIINFTDLSRQLIETGFISGSPWPQPDTEPFVAQIAELAAAKRRRFLLKPVPA
jgi:hypothetical protein